MERLIRAEVCQRPSGQLDLWLVGAVLHLLPATPYKFLLQWVGKERILAAFHEDVEDSAAFLCLRDESVQGRKYLLNEILHHLPTQRLPLFARLVHAVRADDLDFSIRWTAAPLARSWNCCCDPTRRPNGRKTR